MYPTFFRMVDFTCHFAEHSAYLTTLQAATILVAMASEKKFWRPKFWWEATNRLKEKLLLKIINNRTNLINSTSRSITRLSLFPSRRSETQHECVISAAKWRVENVRFGALAGRVIRLKVSSPSHFFAACNMSWSVHPFTFVCFWRLNFFMATILQLKIAKRRLFEKVSLERCLIN